MKALNVKELLTEEADSFIERYNVVLNYINRRLKNRERSFDIDCLLRDANIPYRFRSLVVDKLTQDYTIENWYVWVETGDFGFQDIVISESKRPPSLWKKVCTLFTE